MSNLFILTGLPGAGKSTFANILITIKDNIRYISSDELRKKFPQFKDNHVKIFDIMHVKTIEGLKHNKNVIYDSTNLEGKYRLELYRKIKSISNKTKIINVFIHNGLEHAIIQSEQRKDRSDVNEQLIRNMYTTMQIPNAGIDCDIIMIPKIRKVNHKFEIERVKLYNKNEMKEFIKYIETIDSELIKGDIREDINR